MRSLRTSGSVGGAGWVTIGSTRKAYYLPLCRRFIFLMGDTLNPEVDVFLAESGVPRLPKPFTMAEVQRAIQQALQAV